MDDACTVTFEGTMGGTYYVACSLVEFIDEELVNTGSSTIYLYPAIQQGQSQTNITIPSLGYPYYSSNNYRSYITNAHNVSFNNRSAFYREHGMVQVVLLTALVSVCFIRLMIRRK